jgi:uncharacterized protein YegP (UPF0339 family)
VVQATKNNKFRFVLQAENGQAVLTSQTYANKQGALDGVESVRTNSASDARYERRNSGRGKDYFVLKAANGKIIGNSQEYSSPAAMEAGVASVKRLGPSAVVKEL